MTQNTKIEWADHTFNPWVGCTKISPACDHCYAEGWAKRSGMVQWGPQAERRRTSVANWQQPIKWNRQAQIQLDAWEQFKKANPGLTDEQLINQGFTKPARPRVFCASLADVFDNAVPEQWRDDLWQLIWDTPNLDWLLLTKRVGNVLLMLPEEWGNGLIGHWPNVWIGATICNQAEADRDIPKLLDVPAAKRFLSMEPLLGPVNLTDVPMPESGHGHHEFSPIITGNALARADSSKPKIDWIIVGGESGPHARPMHPDWARSLRDQCVKAGVDFFFKQWGAWRTAVWFDGPDADEGQDDDFCDLDRTDHLFIAKDGRTWDTNGGRYMYPPLPLGHWCLMVKEGKKAAGRLLDGREWNEVPA